MRRARALRTCPKLFEDVGAVRGEGGLDDVVLVVDLLGGVPKLGRGAFGVGLKEHAVRHAGPLRACGGENGLLDALAVNERFPLDWTELDALLANRLLFTGAAADRSPRS